MNTKQTSKNIFIIGIFQIKGLTFKCISATDVSHDTLMSINLNDIAILRLNSADYRCIIEGISKSDAVNLLKNADLTKKRAVL